MSILCTICAREGSKGLSNKALRTLNDKPLIAYTIEQAIKAEIFDNVILSTDSKQIAEKGKSFGADVCFTRPKELATDNSNKIDVIRHALLETEKIYNKKFETIVDLDITSPLRDVSDIQKAIKYFAETKSDNLISACPSKKNPYFNMVEIINGRVCLIKKSSKPIINRQNAPKTYEMNAAIYIWKRDALISSTDLFTNKTCLYEMLEKQSFDIDSEHDLNIVEFLLKKKIS